MAKIINNVNSSKKIGVFIDGANLWHCQKKNRWRIDFYRLKKYFLKRGKIKGLYYFTPNIPHLKNFLTTLDKLGYIIIKKPLKKIKLKTDSRIKRFKHKGNLDMEMGLMMISNADVYDELIILTGDSDFEVVVEVLRSKGKNIIIICNKRALSRELRKVSNQIIYLHQLKKEIKYKRPRSLGAHTLRTGHADIQ